jgi:hypothetical protein
MRVSFGVGAFALFLGLHCATALLDDGLSCPSNNVCKSGVCASNICCSGTIAGCAACGTDGSCIRCRQGYTIFSGFCSLDTTGGSPGNEFIPSPIPDLAATFHIQNIDDVAFATSCIEACAYSGWLLSGTGTTLLLRALATTAVANALTCSCPTFLPISESTSSSYLAKGSWTQPASRTTHYFWFVLNTDAFIEFRISTTNTFPTSPGAIRYYLTSCTSTAASTLASTLCRGTISYSLTSMSPILRPVLEGLAVDDVDCSADLCMRGGVNVIPVGSTNTTYIITPRNIRPHDNCTCNVAFKGTLNPDTKALTGKAYGTPTLGFVLPLTSLTTTFRAVSGTQQVLAYKLTAESCSGPPSFCQGPFASVASSLGGVGKRATTMVWERSLTSDNCLRQCVAAGHYLSISGSSASLVPRVPRSNTGCICGNLTGAVSAGAITGSGAVVSGGKTITFATKGAVNNGFFASFTNGTSVSGVFFVSAGCSPSTDSVCGDTVVSANSGSGSSGGGSGGTTGSTTGKRPKLPPPVVLPAFAMTLSSYLPAPSRRLSEASGSRRLSIDPCLAACFGTGLTITADANGTATVKTMALTATPFGSASCTCPVLRGNMSTVDSSASHFVSGSYESSFYRIVLKTKASTAAGSSEASMEFQLSDSSSFAAYSTIQQYYLTSCSPGVSTYGSNLCRGTISLRQNILLWPGAVSSTCRLNSPYSAGLQVVVVDSKTAIVNSRSTHPTATCTSLPLMGNITGSSVVGMAYTGARFVLELGDVTTGQTASIVTVEDSNSSVPFVAHEYLFDSCLGSSDFCRPYSSKATSMNGGRRPATFISDSLVTSSTAIDSCTRACLVGGYLIAVSGSAATLTPMNLSPSSTCSCSALSATVAEGGILAGTGSISSSTGSSSLSFTVGAPDYDQVAMIVSSTSGASYGSVAYSSPNCSPDCGSLCGDSGTPVACVDATEPASTPNIAAIVGGVVGGLCLVGIIGFGVGFVLVRKQKAVRGKVLTTTSTNTVATEDNSAPIPVPVPPLPLYQQDPPPAPHRRLSQPHDVQVKMHNSSRAGSSSRAASPATGRRGSSAASVHPAPMPSERSGSPAAGTSRRTSATVYPAPPTTAAGGGGGSGLYETGRRRSSAASQASEAALLETGRRLSAVPSDASMTTGRRMSPAASFENGLTAGNKRLSSAASSAALNTGRRVSPVPAEMPSSYQTGRRVSPAAGSEGDPPSSRAGERRLSGAASAPTMSAADSFTRPPRRPSPAASMQAMQAMQAWSEDFPSDSPSIETFRPSSSSNASSARGTTGAATSSIPRFQF